MKTFLLKVTTKGIKNIKSEIAIDFYNKSTIAGFDPTKDRVRAIYGKNGSGKTAFMTSVWIAEQLFNQPNFLAYWGGSYFQNLLNKDDPEFRIEFTFYVESMHGQQGAGRYGFTLGMDGGEVVLKEEHLMTLSGKRLSGDWSTLFLAEDGELKELNIGLPEEWKDALSREAFNRLKSQSFLPLFMKFILQNDKNRLFLGLGEKIRGAMVFEGAIEFLLSLDVLIAFTDTHFEYARGTRSQWSDLAKKNPAEFKNYISHVTFKDQNAVIVPKNRIEDYRDFVRRQAEFIRLFKPELKAIRLKEEEAGDAFEVRRVFVYGHYEISFEFESSGIKRLADLFEKLDGAANGRIVFIDEMDTNVSGPYLKVLTDYFNEFGEGQLCFSAHSLDPMYSLAGKKKAIYFLGEDNKVTPWIRNAHYKPYNLYPEGMIPGLDFPIIASDFLSVFDRGTSECN